MGSNYKRFLASRERYSLRLSCLFVDREYESHPNTVPISQRTKPSDTCVRGRVTRERALILIQHHLKYAVMMFLYAYYPSPLNDLNF